MWGAFVLTIFFVVFPIMFGVMIILNLDERYKRISFVYVAGFIGMMGLFYVPCVISTLAEVKFSILVAIYIMVFCIICCVCWRYHRVEVERLFSFDIMRFIMENKIWIVILLVIAYQILRSVFFMPYIYADDKSYIAMINDIIATDRLYRTDAGTGMEIALSEVSHRYVFASYFPFLAMISKCSGVHPLILCKTIFPIICVSLHYMIAYLLAKLLFRDNREKIGIFMLLYVVLCEFFIVSWYTISLRLLVWSWHNKAVMAAVIIPFVFTYGSDVLERCATKWEYIILLLVSLAACSTTMFGAVLTAIMYVMISLSNVIKKRDIKLLLQGIICSTPTILVIICGYVWKTIY